MVSVWDSEAYWCDSRNFLGCFLTTGFDGGFWSTLLEVNVSHKSLMALNYCLMERCKQVRESGERREKGGDDVEGLVYMGPLASCHLNDFSTSLQTAIARLCATYAAQLYLVLLQLPGQHTYTCMRDTYECMHMNTHMHTHAMCTRLHTHAHILYR